MAFISEFNSLMWGYVLSHILLGTGLVYSIATGFPQLTQFGKIWDSLKAQYERRRWDFRLQCPLCYRWRSGWDRVPCGGGKCPFSGRPWSSLLDVDHSPFWYGHLLC